LINLITLKNRRKSAIGIFDSGIGGLTVAHAINRLLPDENLIYFGDTAHLPYGDKSKASIRQYSEKITRFLIEKRCKAVVIACNTASAIAFSAVKKIATEGDALAFNVIDPVARYAATNYHETRVGVIGTKATVNSRVYVKRIARLNPTLEVTSNATPLLAPMIEEGFFNNNISRTVIASYLSKKHFQGVQALILGCTHYPLIKAEVAEYYEDKAEIIDSAEIVAREVHQRLMKNELLKDDAQPGKHRFYVSDYTESFEKSTRTFFRKGLELKERRLFD